MNFLFLNNNKIHFDAYLLHKYLLSILLILLIHLIKPNVNDYGPCPLDAYSPVQKIILSERKLRMSQGNI